MVHVGGHDHGRATHNGPLLRGRVEHRRSHRHGRGVEGPFTSWYPDGGLESHGSYVDFGARSVPEGVWGFWYPTGQRHTLGRYRRGQPVGCFAVWAEDGTRRTGFVEGEQLRVASCSPPPDDELSIAEGRGHARAATPAWGDVSLQGFVATGGIGARNAGHVDPDPSLRVGLQVAARKRLGRLRVGPTVGLRDSDNIDYRGLAAGGVIAFGLPSLHPRLDAEVAVELGAQYLTAKGRLPLRGGTAELDFWAPLGAAQLGVGFVLSPTIEALAAVRVDGTPTRDVDRQVTYCEVLCASRDETWQIGGFAYGVTLGIRLVIR